MTKQQVMELTYSSVYSIWLQVAIRHFDELDPEHGFEVATNFVRELLKQNPEF